MPSPLFSTYRQGENRITSSTLAVFERIDLALVQDLLSKACGGADLPAVTFRNQVGGAGAAVPDGLIMARFAWWFETKTVVGCYATEGHSCDQFRKHTKQLEDDPYARLFILTPDPVRPSWLAAPDCVSEHVLGRVLWLSFRDLADTIAKVISDPTRVVGEQTRFLLAELVALYENDGLLTADDTVIVAARWAWPEYREVSAYVCQPQPDRTFREGLTHFGFYADSAIQPLIARIRTHYPTVVFTHEEATRRHAAGEPELADLIEQLLENGTRDEGQPYGVFLLSGPSDPETIDLDHPIVNDVKAQSGRPWGWTLNQRYTSLKALQSGATWTSQL